jgi:hypothetical protein
MHVAVFNIIVLLAICIDRINFMVPMFLEPVDMYVNIFGVVFATSASLTVLFAPLLMCIHIYSLELELFSY